MFVQRHASPATATFSTLLRRLPLSDPCAAPVHLEHRPLTPPLINLRSCVQPSTHDRLTTAPRPSLLLCIRFILAACAAAPAAHSPRPLAACYTDIVIIKDVLCFISRPSPASPVRQGWPDSSARLL